ncbi:MAG: ABC transporter substrate binding protein [Pseudomonadota bacterium]
MGCLLVLLSLSGLSTLHAAPLRVGIFHAEEREQYRSFEAALRHELAGLDDITLVSTEAVPQQIDLLVAVGGAKPSQRLSDAAIPVLHVMTSRAQFGSHGQTPSNRTTAIYMDQPLSRQIKLLRTALPQARTIGVLVSSTPAVLAELIPLAEAAGLTVNVQTAAEPSGLAAGLSEVLAVSDALLVLPDAEIYRSDTIRNILLETYRQRVPMIGLSQNYVRAGALCAVYSTPLQIAEQTARIVSQFARTRKLPDYQYPQEFEVAVNTQVARSLGLTIKSAEQLRNEIGERP